MATGAGVPPTEPLCPRNHPERSGHSDIEQDMRGVRRRTLSDTQKEGSTV